MAKETTGNTLPVLTTNYSKLTKGLKRLQVEQSGDDSSRYNLAKPVRPGSY